MASLSGRDIVLSAVDGDGGLFAASSGSDGSRHDHHGAAGGFVATTTPGPDTGGARHGEGHGIMTGMDMNMNMGMGMGMGGNMSSTMAMMFFHAGTDEVILFDFWRTPNLAAFIGSWIGVLAMSMAFEWLKFYRDCMCAEDREKKNKGLLIPRSALVTRHLVNTALYAVQTILGYLLMLVFMIYNVHLCVSITLGATLGFFFFRYRRPDVERQSVQHCDCMD